MKVKIYIDWENQAVYSERDFNRNREYYENDFEDDQFEDWLSWTYTPIELYNIGKNQTMFIVDEAWNAVLEGEMQDYDARFECITIETDEEE